MQHSTLSKRCASGRLDEVATCVRLWLGAAPAPAPPGAPQEGAAPARQPGPA